METHLPNSLFIQYACKSLCENYSISLRSQTLEESCNLMKLAQSASTVHRPLIEGTDAMVLSEDLLK